MTVRRRKFELDREQGKLLGVCAGLANHSGIDVTLIRVAVVLVTLMGAFPWSLFAYAAAAFFAQRRTTAPRSRFDSIGVRRTRPGSGNRPASTRSSASLERGPLISYLAKKEVSITPTASRAARHSSPI